MKYGFYCRFSINFNWKNISHTLISDERRGQAESVMLLNVFIIRLEWSSGLWWVLMRTTPDNEWPSLLHFPTPQTHKQIQTAHFQSPTTRAWTINSGQWSELECWRQVTRYLQCVIITINYLIWVQAVSRSRMSQSQVWYELWPGNTGAGCLVTSGQHTPDTVPVSGPTTGHRSGYK